MKYRIYRYAVKKEKNGQIQNVKVDIKTDDIERSAKFFASRKETRKHTIHLYYETNEPYKD